MAGTDSSHPFVPEPDRQPCIVLVRPQLGENIGTAARAMLNCGLTDLRLVAPRDGWPNPNAAAAAAGADMVLEGVRAFDTLAEALADRHRVYATTARNRGMSQMLMPPRPAAAETHAEIAAGKRVAYVFGAERTGLTNDELAQADTLVAVPLNPAFSSLNLAQAVLLMAYEWSQAERPEAAAAPSLQGQSPPATGEQVEGFLGQLFDELDRCGFLRVQDKRPSMMRNLRNLFERAHLTEQEVRTLRGVIACLVERARTHPPREG